MKIKIMKIFVLLFLVSNLTFAQGKGDPTLLKIGYHTGNRAGISYYNDGQIAGFRQGVDIRGEWPLGSGENYIGDCIPLIGVEFTNNEGKNLQSVVISRGPRNGQGAERHPTQGYFWGWNPIPGFLNPNGNSVAMSHLKDSWPIGGWSDPGGFPEVTNYVDKEGNTEWWGYFGRGIIQADQESFFVSDDQKDDEFNANFLPNSNDPLRKGMGLQLRQRGFQWASFLAEDVIFWLYDIKNEGTTTYRRADFGTVVGTLAGGDGDSGDDLGFFDTERFITYSWDSDGIGNIGQKVGYIGYAFLESPGNPFDGIDNDGDSENPSSPRFKQTDFLSVKYNLNDNVILINPNSYERITHKITAFPDTVYSLGVQFVLNSGTELREGHIASILQGVNIPDVTAYDGIDNDLDGLVDENESIHYNSRIINHQDPVKFINYFTGEGLTDLLIDEKRDNDIDEDGDWDAIADDLGQDGLGPEDETYPGPDLGEGDGKPTQGEPNFGRTDPDESDQIGLTAFNFFNLALAPDLSVDSSLWNRMTPGRFDEIPRQPQDGDFIYASGYFPLIAGAIERFSVALLFGEDLKDIQSNQIITRQIYNSGYKFPQPPRKPKITITQDDGNVVIYWDPVPTETTRDFITKKRDFQGYKIYRSTDAGFLDARKITNAVGVLSFDKPIAQYDLADTVSGYYYPSPGLLAQIGGTTYYLGDNSGVVNKFVDSTVVPGQTYFYAVVAYDAGDEELEIFPSENSKFIFRETSGNILTDDNTGYIIPGRRPAGYTQAKSLELVKSSTFRATGDILVEIIDDSAIMDGYKYQLVFSDTAMQNITKDYSLLDLQTPTKVFVPTLDQEFYVDPKDSISIPSGNDTLVVNDIRVPFFGTFFKADFDTLIKHSGTFEGNTKVVQGFRLQLLNDWIIKEDTAQSGFIEIVDTLKPVYTLNQFTVPNKPQFTGINMPYDYEFEFFPEKSYSSVADTLGPANIPTNIFKAQATNFTVRNLSTGKNVDYVYFKSGSLTTVHSIYFKEVVNGSKTRTWKVIVTYKKPNASLPLGGKLKIVTTKPFSHYDEVQFSVKGAEINSALAKADLKKINVVPNPYIVTHNAEARLQSSQTGRGEREIRFTYIPPQSTIKIFTVRGELIKELRHDDLFVGDVSWNLRTEENIDTAYGVYVYVVEIPNVGKKIGKFALIK